MARLRLAATNDKSTNTPLAGRSSSTKVLEAEPPTATSSPELISPSNSGIAILATVSFLWGTFAPAIRYLYQQDTSLSPAYLTGVRGTVSASALLLAGLLTRKQSDQQKDSSSSSSTNTGLLLAGLELGVWNFLGTSCQATGLELTTATKAGFLIQLTGVMTPCLAYLLGETIPGTVWKACALALIGSCMIALDEMDMHQVADTISAAITSLGAPITSPEALSAVAAGAAASPLADERGSGDAIVILSCFFYSMCTVRLSKYAPKYEAVQLAGTKLMFFAGLSVMWLLAEEMLHLTERPNLVADTATSLEAAASVAAAASADGGVSSWMHALLPAGLANPLAASVLIYSAVGPGAMGSFLQTKGQAEVPAAQAQVIFSLTPVWSALLASAFLPGESMGALAWSGAAVIIAASVWVAAASSAADSAKQAQ
jgi:drug/metabolite transporter (DMT)-like permease